MNVTPTTATRLPIRTSTTDARFEKGSHSISVKGKARSWVGYHGARSSQDGEENGEFHAVVITNVIISMLKLWVTNGPLVLGLSDVVFKTRSILNVLFVSEMKIVDLF
jgi:hypothetical protein